MRKVLFGGMMITGLLALAVALGASRPGEAAQGKGPLLSHDVYFTLNQSTPEARKKLVEACKKYLSQHSGEVFFATGTLVEDLKREVNDRDFDVALHIVFQDRASHDKYQDAPRHKQFIEENQASWKKVRVFDSMVEK
jgi:hypothetical protein